MGWFWFRVALSPLDSEALVVRDVVSCLEVSEVVGMDVRSLGRGNCPKGLLFDRKWRD